MSVTTTPRSAMSTKPEDQPEVICPHCETKLLALRMPDGGGWDEPYHWVCFNDDCTYFRDGWTWMQQKYEIGASYRYRVTNAETGQATPIAVWSNTAMRDHIIDEEGDRQGQDGAEENE